MNIDNLEEAQKIVKKRKLGALVEEIFLGIIRGSIIGGGTATIVGVVGQALGYNEFMKDCFLFGTVPLAISLYANLFYRAARGYDEKHADTFNFYFEPYEEAKSYIKKHKNESN